MTCSGCCNAKKCPFRLAASPNLAALCRDAASAELDAGLLLEVHVALQRILASGIRPDLYQPMADAIWNLYDWLRALGEGKELIPKGFEASERVWAGKEVRT